MMLIEFGTEWGPLFFALFFWIGVAVLVAAALMLRFASTPPDEPDAARGADPGSGAARLVQTIRRGGVRLSIWGKSGRQVAQPRHHVRVDQHGPHCDDCVDCMNQALRWIREHEASG